jgi:tetratricopeptide (TPR) repeat protein
MTILKKIPIYIRLISIIGTIICVQSSLAADRTSGAISTSKTPKLNRQTTNIAQNNPLTAPTLLKAAQQKYDRQDYRGALADLNRVIQLNPKLPHAYSYRGFLKASQLHDIRGGLTDLNYAIQLNPNFAGAYRDRGGLKAELLRDIQGGLADYNRAIQLDPAYALAYGERGKLKYNLLTDKSGGISDMQQAARLYQKRGDTKNYRVAVVLLTQWQQDLKNSTLR